MSKTIDVTQVGATLREGMIQDIETAKRAQYRAALRGVAVVASDTPVDRGATRAAWRALPTMDGAELRNDSAIAGILELGSRPHRPPLEPIARWLVRQEGIDLKGGARSFGDLSELPPQTMAVAMAIVRKIEREGTDGHFMVRDNLERLVRILQRETERMLELRDQ